MIDKTQLGDVCSAGISSKNPHEEATSIHGYYTAECHGADGKLKWKDEIHNLVTTAGKNKTMDTTLGNTAGGAVYMGLVTGTGTGGTTTPVYAAGDIQSSHTGWNEAGSTYDPHYSGTRASPTFAAASGGAKTTNGTLPTFSITTSGRVYGCFINIGGTSAIDNTTGTLFSEGTFTGGYRDVINGDVITVTYTATAA